MTEKHKDSLPSMYLRVIPPKVQMSCGIHPSTPTSHCLKAVLEMGRNNLFQGTCGISQGQPKQASEVKEKLLGKATQVLAVGNQAGVCQEERVRESERALAEPATQRCLRFQHVPSRRLFYRNISRLILIGNGEVVDCCG